MPDASPSSSLPGSPRGSLAAPTPKPVRVSQAEMTELVLPNDANTMGNVLGGKVMNLVDLCGAIAACRHASRICVTASVDHMDFRHPVTVGELLILKASVNRVFTTSMEVGVKVYAESMQDGERRHTSSAYLTFVAVDEHGGRQAVPQVIPETDAERRRFEAAGARRAHRLAQRPSQESSACGGPSSR
ncbi:MAG TPA: acyl-CoA thioesterase [Terriglobales bacterium]|nr:acyl-CoA thioesterase [Terriglobales bacterium]